MESMVFVANVEELQETKPVEGKYCALIQYTPTLRGAITARVTKQYQK
jgi:hypothetical protein